MVRLKISKWDVVDHLNSEEDIAGFLNAVLEENDPLLFQVALGDVARARSMGKVAKDIGVGRESLYKSLSENGNPSFQTIKNVIESLGLKIEVAPVMK